MRSLFFLLLIPCIAHSQFGPQEIAAYRAKAKNVTIIRDHYGIPHIYGKTDADAVFGLLYTECEEDFPRVERNYLEMMGRLSELDGKSQLYQDLEMRLLYDSSGAKKDYRDSPAWFKKLLDAFADGVNYYLVTHPSVKPKRLTRFEPWFALMYTDGSIAPTQTGGLTSQDIRSLYTVADKATTFSERRKIIFEAESSGSNGFAVGPSKTENKNSILYINPHVTFYFRMEAHMVSDEGLNAYGAVTWGQFFIYQGFNQHCGWMHTSSYADVADLYEEKTSKNNNGFVYEYDKKTLPVKSKQIVINYKNGDNFSQQSFTTYATHHGPVMGARNGKWLSLRENNRSLTSLMQSWVRTKSKGFKDYQKAMEMRANNSNNTVFADDKGNIAYWHGNFMPKRDTKFDWSLPVDGSTSATEWKGIHALGEIVHVYNPATGWIENCNSTPFTVSGSSSPKKESYPAYMAPDGQNFRAINAIRLLNDNNNFTIDKMISAVGYNRYLSAFEILLPPLIKAYDDLPPSDLLRQTLKEPVDALRSWDKYASANSIATTIAIEWAGRISSSASRVTNPYETTNAVAQVNSMVLNTSPKDKLNMLAATLTDIEKRFGKWQTSWGEVNRYQRNGGINETFDDKKTSLPVGLGPATFGSIPSYISRRFTNTSKRYGLSGNSFIACIEFGKRLKAKTIMTGGESSDPNSKHFTDQAEGYINGNFKDIFFYKEDVLKHAERTYRPGEGEMSNE
ncbi:MAG: acylase [Chitinophagaceae bacterium]|nr:acylase [Chitinophagaceae bacterium]